MIIAHVIPLSRSIDSEVLSYFSARDIAPGTLVTVPLRKQEIKALVVQTQDVKDIKSQLRSAQYQIRNIIQVHDESVYSPEFLQVCTLIKNFYATTTGKVLQLLSPKFVTKNLELFSHTKHTSPHNTFQEKLLQQNTKERISFYKTLIREKMTRSESLHIVCPTKEITEHIFQEVSAKITDKSYMLHGSLTQKKFKIVYEHLQESEKSSLLVSTPQFLDTYQHNKKTLVIEKEASEHYYSITKPYLDTRLVVREYARLLGIECIWADSVLRPETWHQHLSGNAQIQEPFNKKIFKGNEITILRQHSQKKKQSDAERIKELTEKSSFNMILPESLASIKKTLKQKGTVFIFSPKKALAPNITCRDCGNIARSPETGHPLSLYIRQNPKTKIKERIMICHMSGESFTAFDQCQFCSGYNLINLGIGAQGIAQYLEEHFPRTEIIIAEGSTLKTKKQKQELHEKIHANKGIIVIGTKKGLQSITQCDLGIISSLETYFSKMNYSMNQKVLDIITELTEKSSEPIIIQTRNILEDMLPVVTDGFYKSYIEHELELRRNFEFPPYNTNIIIKKKVKREDFKKTYSLLNRITQNYNPQIRTKPGIKKGEIIIIVHLIQAITEWNINHQNKELQNILTSLDRSYEIRINSESLE